MTKVGFGLVSCQRHPGDRRGWADRYREALELAEYADRLGLDSIWTTEHHFVDDGYMPSQLVTLAAMAARTSRIEVATGVLLAPLHDPLRLAEDAATADLLSGGRLVLGLGLGWSEIEYRALGADMRRRGRAMDEILTILPAAWSGRPVQHDGAVYHIPGVAVRPTPDRRIPIVIGGGAEPALRRAAALADGFFSNAPPDRLAEQAAIVADERERAGITRPFTWIWYSMLYVTDDPERGWAEIRDHVHATRWKYRDMVASAVREPGPLPEPPPLDEAAERELRAATLVGTPEQIAAEVRRVAADAGTEFDFVARSYYPGLGFEQQAEQVRLLAEGVAPLLRGPG